MSDINAKSLGDSLAAVSCLGQNAVELINDFRSKYIDPATGRLNVDTFEEGVAAFQTLWDKIKETVKECYNEEVVIDLGDSLGARIFVLLLAAIRFKL